jgi:general secretion pathway protein G
MESLIQSGSRMTINTTIDLEPTSRDHTCLGGAGASACQLSAPVGSAGGSACPTIAARKPRTFPHLRGFTFVEMMVVVTIIVILISMAIPIYNRSIIRAKESVLANNLFTLRTVIDNYSADKQKAPQNLTDLVTEGYLTKLPIDPMTGSNQSWRTIMEDASQSINQSEPGIFDVYSGSDKTSLSGTPYADRSVW